MARDLNGADNEYAEDLYIREVKKTVEKKTGREVSDKNHWQLRQDLWK